MNYLIKRKALLDAGLAIEGSDNKLISFNNLFIKIKDGAVSDMAHVVIPTIEEVVKIINKSVAGAHKQIIGTATYDDLRIFEVEVENYETSGMNLIDTEGNPITYSKAEAKAGDIIIITSSKHPTEEDYFYTEELVVLGDKSLAPLSENNALMGKIKWIESYIEENDIRISELSDKDKSLTESVKRINAKLLEIYDKDSVDNSQNAQDLKIDKNIEDIKALILRVVETETDITRDYGAIKSLAKRIEKAEDALAAIENKWSGDVALQSSIDLSSYEGNDGHFSFKIGEKVDVLINKGTDQIPGVIVVGGSTTGFTKDAHSIDIAIAAGGSMSVTSSTSDQIDTWHIVGIIQRVKATNALNPGYTIGESDAKYETIDNVKTITNALKVKIAKNALDITKKLNSTEPGLETTSKGVVASINELRRAVVRQGTAIDGKEDSLTKKNIKFTMDDGTVINLKGIV